MDYEKAHGYEEELIQQSMNLKYSFATGQADYETAHGYKEELEKAVEQTRRLEMLAEQGLALPHAGFDCQTLLLLYYSQA